MRDIPVTPIVFIVALAVLGYYFFGIPGDRSPKEARVRIGGRSVTVDVVTTTLAQARGLSGRPSLADDEGMLFVFATSSYRNFWMKDMNFPIDIVWIDQGKIVGITANVLPEPGKSVFELPTYRSPAPADMVLEVNAGVAARAEWTVGMPVSYER